MTESDISLQQTQHTLAIADVRCDGKYLIITTEGDINVTRPGQYCKLRYGDVEQYSAISNWPVIGRQQFIIKSSSQFGRAFTENQPVNIQLVGHVAGGFDCTGITDKPVWLLAGGSGIAAINALVEFIEHTSMPLQHRRVKVLYAESDDHFFDVDARSIDVCKVTTSGVLSDNPNTPILGMLTHLSGMNIVGTYPNVPIVFACGAPAFIDRLRAGLVGIIPREDFRLNYEVDK